MRATRWAARRLARFFGDDITREAVVEFLSKNADIARLYPDGISVEAAT